MRPVARELPCGEVVRSLTLAVLCAARHRTATVREWPPTRPRTLKLRLKQHYSKRIFLVILAAGLSTCLWIGAGFVGEEARLLLVYAAGALCPLVLALLWGTAWLRNGCPTAAGQESAPSVEAGRQALRDSLTGLANRASFEDHLERAIARSRRSRHPVGVLCIDLDHFKRVNDTHGHAVGDKLLEQVARRLEDCLRATDIVARWGGDEFLVGLPELADRQDAVRIAEKLGNALRNPFEIDGYSIAASGTIGVSLYPDDAQDLALLCENADRAMYRAKAEGRGRVTCYAPELGEMARERRDLEQHLRKALDKGELVLFYQPQFDLKTRKLAGLEALLRWRHPKHGVLRPDRFLSVAEDSGLIVPIGDWTLEAACRQVRGIQNLGCSPIRIAVNVSRPQFFRPGFEETVRRAVREAGIAPASLALELTEGLVMQDFNRSRQEIEKLRRFGVHVSIDDFGAGGASLSLLQRLPIDSLKIHRGFIQELGPSRRSMQLVDSIIHLAHGLGVAAVAEGVETIPQLKALRSLGCDLAQGYLFGMPLPAGDIWRWMSHDRVLCAVRPRSVMPPARNPMWLAQTAIHPLPTDVHPTKRTLATSLSVAR
jgi:diguanylate cyclase (GGDEF)-like protein